MSMRQLKITKSITNRESQSLEKYLQEIGKVELNLLRRRSTARHSNQTGMTRNHWIDLPKPIFVS